LIIWLDLTCGAQGAAEAEWAYLKNESPLENASGWGLRIENVNTEELLANLNLFGVKEYTRKVGAEMKIN
jgi:hypothetical protein